MTRIGPTDGNLDALRRREEELDSWLARMTDCPCCNGTGEIDVLVHGRAWGDPDGIYDVDSCDNCGGTGEIEAEEEDE